MWQYIVLLICVCCISTLSGDDVHTLARINSDLVLSLRDDANLDLSTDVEYEDLRAELLASHTALANLVDGVKQVQDNARRMSDTPCWNRNGICVALPLCTGYNYLTEVPGCKEKFKVCCFVWNQFHVRDMREHGFSNLAMPWSIQEEFGGGGVVEIDTSIKKKRRPKKFKKENLTENLADKAIAILLRYKNKY